VKPLFFWIVRVAMIPNLRGTLFTGEVPKDAEDG